VRTLDVGSFNAGLVLLRTGGTPTFIYNAGTSPKVQVWAAHLPETDDAGVSLSLSYQITRGNAAGGLQGKPLVRVAQSGEIRVAYMEQVFGTYAARYVTWNGDFNQTPTDVVVSPYNLFSFVQIGFDLDPQDRPGIVYFPMDFSGVLATNSGAGWQTSTFVSGVNASFGQLAFDGSGTANVFWDGQSGLTVNSNNGTGWLGAAPIDPPNGGNSALIVGRDGLGRVEIIYSQTVQYRAMGTAGAWTLGQSLPDVISAFSPIEAVVFGAGGEIHAAYLDQGQVKYASFDGCTWSTQVVDTNSTAGVDLRIALDSSGAPHFSYQSTAAGTSPAGGDLWYASPTP
jgi:hypothetical protein